MGAQFQSGKMNKVLEMDGGHGYTMRMHLPLLNCTFKTGYESKFYAMCMFDPVLTK